MASHTPLPFPRDYRPVDADPDTNYCRCGCGRAIPWQTSIGLPMEYYPTHTKFRARRQRPKPTPAGVAPITSEDVGNWTAETIQQVPEAFLVGVLQRIWKLGRQVGRDESFVQMVVGECRRRKLAQVDWICNTLISPPCACGKPGHYIIGKVTYCKACAETVGRRRLQAFRAQSERKKEVVIDAREEHLKRLDRARQHHQARGRTRGNRGYK